MSPRQRAFLQFFSLVVVAVGLILLFRPVAALAEVAARELRYLWWVILLVALAAWLIWGIGRKPKQ